MIGALVFTTSCGPKKYKIDDSTVLPFKDKAELDSILDLPIMPEYTIEEYYTLTDFVDGDERFVVYCKFLKEVTPEEVNKIVAQVDNGQYERWCTFDLGTENTMGIFFNHDITLAAGQKRPDILGDKIHIESQIPCRENESWKGFKVVFSREPRINCFTLTKYNHYETYTKENPDCPWPAGHDWRIGVHHLLRTEKAQN